MDARKLVRFVADLLVILVLGAVYVACLTVLTLLATLLGALKKRIPTLREERRSHTSSQ